MEGSCDCLLIIILLNLFMLISFILNPVPVLLQDLPAIVVDVVQLHHWLVPAPSSSPSPSSASSPRRSFHYSSH